MTGAPSVHEFSKRLSALAHAAVGKQPPPQAQTTAGLLVPIYVGIDRPDKAEHEQLREVRRGASIGTMQYLVTAAVVHERTSHKMACSSQHCCRVCCAVIADVSVQAGRYEPDNCPQPATS